MKELASVSRKDTNWKFRVQSNDALHYISLDARSYLDNIPCIFYIKELKINGIDCDNLRFNEVYFGSKEEAQNFLNEIKDMFSDNELKKIWGIK